MKANLFSIGGMRCGSTTIYHHLSSHPQIYMSPVKEPYFFSAEYWKKKDSDVKLSQRELTQANKIIHSGKYRTPKAYRTLFQGVEDQLYAGEASHYLYHPGTAELIYEYNPCSKIIISLRNPVDRIYSEYLLYVRQQRITISFDKFITSQLTYNKKEKIWDLLPGNRLVKGFYSQLIPKWLEYFGKENVIIVYFDDLVQNPALFCHQLYTSLGVDTTFRATSIHAQAGGKVTFPSLFNMIGRNYTIKHIIKPLLPRLLRVKMRGYFYQFFLQKEPMSPQTRKILHDVYFEEILQLEQLLLKDLSQWKHPNQS